mgnify:CR=1 FL=1
MDNKYYLAVDIGASSGRHMLCHLEDHKMVLEEIYRFSNGMTSTHDIVFVNSGQQPHAQTRSASTYCG